MSAAATPPKKEEDAAAFSHEPETTRHGSSSTSSADQAAAGDAPRAQDKHGTAGGACCLPPAEPSSQVADSEPKPWVAWLIGQKNYANGFDKLPRVENDVTKMEKTFEHLGFECEVRWNLTKCDFETFPRECAQSLRGRRGSIFVLYFAGHGLSLAGQTALVPVDGSPADPTSFVILNDVLQTVHDLLDVNSAQRARHAKEVGALQVDDGLMLVFLDCCRRWKEAGVKYRDLTGVRLPRPYVQAEVCILFACDEGRYAYEADPKFKNTFTVQELNHGIFTLALLKSLGTPGLPWYDLWHACREECLRLAGSGNKQQRCWMYDSTSKARNLVLHVAHGAAQSLPAVAGCCGVNNVEKASPVAAHPTPEAATLTLVSCCVEEMDCGSPPQGAREQDAATVEPQVDRHDYLKFLLWKNLIRSTRNFSNRYVRAAIDKAVSYASDHTEFIDERHDFPDALDQDAAVVWGLGCFMALFRYECPHWVFFDHNGPTESYSLPLAYCHLGPPRQ